MKRIFLLAICACIVAAVFAMPLKLKERNKGKKTYKTEQLSTELDYSIFPNPFTDFISISTISATEITIDVELYDVLGKVIYEDVVTLPAGNPNLNINLKGMILERGYYLLRVENEGNVETFRLLHQ